MAGLFHGHSLKTTPWKVARGAASIKHTSTRLEDLEEGEVPVQLVVVEEDMKVRTRVTSHVI